MITLMATKERRSGAFTDGGSLDATDRRLLAELQADARLSLAELGRRVGLSSPAVAERLRRLEGDGVISGYHAKVDPARLGFGLGVLVRIRPAPRQLAAVAQLARETAEIVECLRVTGDDCYVMTAHVRDVVHLEKIIDAFAAYGQTTTSVMQSAPVPRRGVAVDV
jgi:Lrp/AsnC family transcriptional regulator, leucine-responsive regulatory protein